MLMSGSWHIYRPGERWQKPASHMRIVIENSDYVAVGFTVPVAEMHTAQSLARNRKIPHSDTDLLSETFDADAAARRLPAHGDEELADVLLHQEVLAGVGNVFKSEICFVTGLNPFCKVAALTAEQVDGVIAAARRLLAANVLEDSGDAIVTYGGRKRRTTHESDPSASLWVYDRKGEPCRRCGEPIRKRMQGPDARVTFWCPRCQPMPDGREIDG
jgi:endonuclease-8